MSVQKPALCTDASRRPPQQPQRSQRERTTLVATSLLFAVSIGLYALVDTGCTSVNVNGVAGAECFTTADCANGLTCVPGSAGQRSCSDDLSKFSKVPTQPSDAAVDADPGDAAGSDVQTKPDTQATPDTGTDTGTDSGAPKDSGNVQDARADSSDASDQ